MFRSLFHFASALAVVASAYALYAQIAVPMIEGEGVRAKAATNVSYQSQSSAPVDNSYLIDGLIPEDSWEHQGCKIVETQQGLVMFKEYTFHKDGRVEVRPFTMIAMENSNAINARGTPREQKDPPVILRSPQGAILVFDGNEGTGGLGFGNLIGGQLPGDVDISRGASSEFAYDGLHLKAHNVQIDGPNIITPHDVHFRMGRSYGSGRSLTIVLDQKEQTDPDASADLTKVKGIKRLELASLNELVLQTQGGMDGFAGVETSAGSAFQTAETDQQLQPGSPPGNQRGASDKQWTRVSVNCSGPFEFDFEQSVASFSGDVHIERLRNEGGKGNPLNETLDCQKLDILFDGQFFPDEPAEDTSYQQVVSDKPESSSPQIRAVIASGNPSVLNIPEREVIARASSIEFEIAAEKVKLRDPVAVTLRDPQHRIVAPELEYTLGIDGRIGIGWAPGPGRIEKFAVGDDEGFVATWGIEMNIRPHQGKTAISLYERAHIDMGDEKSFDAGELHLWLWEIPVVDQSGAIKKGRWRLLPAQMLATDDVTFNTEQIAGTTQQAQGFWPKPSVQPATGMAAIETSADPKENSSNGLAKSLLVKSDKPQKNLWRVSTGQAHFHLDADNKLQMLELVDSVEIREQSVPYSRDNLVIQGNSLIVTPTKAVDQFNINVIGNPAVIAGRSQTMYGNVITLDQTSNTIVVPGEGKMRIETLGDELTKGLDLGNDRQRPQQGPQFADPNLPRKAKSISIISWKESLQFDGRVLTLTGEANVQSKNPDQNGGLNVINAKAGQIEATLNQSINFQKTERKQSIKPEVTVLNLSGNVDIKNHTYIDAEELKSIDRITGQEIEIDTRTGDIVSTTAGSVETTRAGKITSPKMFAGEAINSPSVGLSFLQVNYAAGFNGNLFKKEMVFHRHIRAIYGPVSNWAEKLNIQQQQSNPSVTTMNCDQLSVGQWRPDAQSESMVEMRAGGNVEIRSLAFRTLSHTVDFYQESDMIVIQGSGGKPAQIWYRDASGSADQYTHTEANQIKYWRERGQIEVDQLEKAEYTSQEPVRTPAPRSGSNRFQPPRIRGR